MKTKRYVLTEDISWVFSRIRRRNSIASTPIFERAIGNYVKSVTKILSKALGAGVSLKLYSKPEIENEMARTVIDVMMKNERSLCICLDRNLLTGLEKSAKYRSRFFRFQICRNNDNVKVPRHHAPSFEDQIRSLKKMVKKNRINEFIVVDIGMFSGKTVHKLIDILLKKGLKIPITHIVTYVSRSEAEETFQNIRLVNYLEYKDIYEWVDMHDFTPTGGKILKKNGNSLEEAVPYIFPWSNGKSASLHLSPDFFALSRNLITTFKKLVDKYDLENPSRPLRLLNILKGGFSIPNNKDRTLTYKKDMRVSEYLKMCLGEIAKEKKRKVVVFDMDGTLYTFKNNDGFSGSLLNAKVKENALKFIAEKEMCSPKEALKIREKGLSHRIGLSVYLAERYGTSREDYFDTVWNIDPDGMIETSGVSKNLKAIKKETGSRFVLLSAAPSIWVEKVLKYLGVFEHFDDIYSAEDFGHKEEVFRMLSKRYNSKNCLSVGDQLKTDIEPARSFGIKTWHVNGPEELKNWKKIVLG